MSSVLTQLPVELIEQILVQTVSEPAPSPKPIANLSLSCKHLYNTINHPDNSHIWYSIFLAAFDDPGRLAEWKAGNSPGRGTESSRELDWKNLFINQMKAKKVFGLISSRTKRVSRTETTEALCAIVESLTSISPATTSASAPSLTAIWSPFSTFFATSHNGSDELAVTGSLPPTFAAHLYALPLPTTELSRNSQWVGSIFLSKRNNCYQDEPQGRNRYYPRRLLLDHILGIPENDEPTSSTFSSSSPPGGSQAFWDLKLVQDQREKEAEAQAFSQVVLLMGSGPISTQYPPILLKRGFSRLPFDANSNGQGSSSSNSGDWASSTREPEPTDEDTRDLNASADEASEDESIATDIDDVQGQLLSLKSDYDLARQRARRIVYNMRYLIKERSWGPFKVHDFYKKSVEERERKRAEREGRVQSGLLGDLSAEMAWIPAVLEQFGILGNMDDSEDEIQDDEDEIASDDDSEGEEEVQEHDAQGFGSGVAAGEREDLPPNNIPQPVSCGTLPPTARQYHKRPLLHQFEPDFQFLAACRIVIEANLRERGATSGAGGFVPPVPGIGVLGSSITTQDSDEAIKLSEGFGKEGEPEQVPLALEMLRAGSAPGYKGLFPPEESGKWDDVEEDVKGKGKEVVEEYVEWDWAGVEGEWRRVVCFLDYRDLLLFNMERDSPRSSLHVQSMQEAVRVIPMTMNITGYLPPPPRPSGKPTCATELVYKLPVIQFEGHTRASDSAMGPSRRVSGSVRMCESGHVRWEMCSHNPETGEREWASENVQIGDIGSAMGVIGTWTGANHTRNDPLGPSWAWKIS